MELILLLIVMDLMYQGSSAAATGSPLMLLVNNIVLTYLSGYSSVCVVKTSSEFILIDVPVPTMVITVDEKFYENLHASVEGGCQAFVVQHWALEPFLDTFMDAHDYADQRSSDKKLIVLLDSLDVELTELICSHLTMRDLPDVLIVVHSNENESLEFYTTDIFGDGSRGTVIVQLQPVIPPEFFPKKGSNLKAMPIRYQTVLYLPFINVEETTAEKANARKDPRYYTDDTPLLVDGTESLLLVEFCARYNCSIETFVDEVDFWGTVDANRKANGVLGAVATRKADFAVSAIYFWADPYRFATYTGPISRSGETVIVPKPQIVSPWRTPFLSFRGNLWIAVGIAFCVGALSVWLVEKGRLRIKGLPNEQPRGFSEAVLTMIGFYMEQNAFLRNDLVSCVFLFTALLFAGFMVGNLYGAGLAGIMTIPQYEKAIETGMDLAASRLPFVGNDWAWMFALRPSPQAHIQAIVKQYKVVDDDYMVQHRNIRDIGYVAEKTQFGHVGPVDYLDVGSSNLFQLLKEDLTYQYCTALVTKTCPFKQKFNDLLGNIQQSGIQYYWETEVVNRYMSLTIQQNLLLNKPSSADSDAVVLTVLHFMGAFMILGLGCSFASVLFCLECCYFKCVVKRSSSLEQTRGNNKIVEQ